MINLNPINTYPRIAFVSKENNSKTDVYREKPCKLSFKGVNEPENPIAQIDSNSLLQQTCSLRDVKDLILKIIDLKNHNIYNHCLRTSMYAKAFAKEEGMPEKKVEEIELGALFHDVGKIGVPDRHFEENPDQISTEANRRHSFFSFEILNKINPFKGSLANIALNHHERWDGGDSPNNTKGDEIPVEASMVSLSDVFDSQTSAKYPGQTKMPVDEAIQELREYKGKRFKPELVEDFIKLVSKDDFALYKQAQSTVN